MLDPNAEVGANWKYATVYVESEDDGFPLEESVSGFLRKDGDKEVELLVAANQLERFPRDRVSRVEINELTKMPGNYTEILTLQQMADLVTYGVA